VLSQKHDASDFKFKGVLSRKHDASDFKFKRVLSRKHDASDFKFKRVLSRKHDASDFKFKGVLSRKHDASDFNFKGVLSRKHDASDFKYERYTNFFTKVNFKYLGITIFYLNVGNYNRLYCELISNYLKCLGLPRIILTCIYSHRIIHAVYLRLTLNHDFS